MQLLTPYEILTVKDAKDLTRTEIGVYMGIKIKMRKEESNEKYW
ncbi:hypothetical protein NWP96_00245 [Mycoplasmopsis cynos]|nr:hypothetical protein [Mycoplasmopsis cynos]